MTLYATVYALSIQHLESPVHSRIDCYVRLNNGQLIVLREEGKTGHLSKKYQFEIVTGDRPSIKGRACKLIKNAQGIRFGKLLDD